MGPCEQKKKKESERESQRRCASWQREIHGLSVALAKYPWTEAHNTVHPHPPFFLSQILNSYFFFRSQCSGSRLGFSSPRVFLRALWISGVGFVSGMTVSTLDVCEFSTLALSLGQSTRKDDKDPISESQVDFWEGDPILFFYWPFFVSPRWRRMKRGCKKKAKSCGIASYYLHHMYFLMLSNLYIFGP